MADDSNTPPRPRPRRRRTDIDPNAPSPPVANERRRRRAPTGADGSPLAPLAGAAALDAVVDSPGESVGSVEEGTKVFHVPGMAVAATAAAVAGGAGAAGEAASAAASTGNGGGSRDDVRSAAVVGAPVADLDPPADEPAPTVDQLAPAAGVGAAPTWLAVLDDRSPDPRICPFLRATGAGGRRCSPRPSRR